MAVGQKNKMKICLLGASFSTGNLGVSALAESSIKIILSRWPNAEVILLGSGYTPSEYHLKIMGREITVRTIPIRFSKNILLPYHFLWFVFYGFLVKVLPQSRLKDALINHNSYFKNVYEAELALDITGGDSFSDIYGFRRFFLGFLCKWVLIFLGKRFILLPQTYGPYKKPLTRIMARYILNHAGIIYSRDRAGVDYVDNLLGNHNAERKIRLVPDVAFVLDSRKPAQIDVGQLLTVRTKESIVVGLNVSALLFNGGYTRDNMFGLKTDYQQLVYAIIELLMEDKRTIILLVPHVFPPARCEIESDPDVCSRVYESTAVKYPDRIFFARGKYDQSEIKYIIGLCDFFIGSRMHACIAAMSQNIPTVGIAYSKKFAGVFENIGLSDCVADIHNCDEKEVLEKVESVFRHKDRIHEHLKRVVFQAKENILNMFKDWDEG